MVSTLHSAHPEGENGMKGRTWKKSVSLGDLIAALFEETAKVSSDPVEQNLLVYVALNDLLKGPGAEAPQS